jgi:hypothetical protein
VPLIVCVAAAVALAGVAGYAIHVALENGERADEWRDRSELLQDLVGERTRALNRQTARLNRAATSLREARRSIARSEEDVAALEERQLALANEKAQVEDQRAALLGVASQLQTCNAGMRDVIRILGEGLVPEETSFGDLVDICNGADAAVGGYVAAYGGQ